jgi:hypothetical protein
MYWLDVSGLALYFLDRITQLGLSDCIPVATLDRLQKNLSDNYQRTASLFSEAAALSARFTRKNVEFALLKGISLCPDSVPNAALRCQMDLDMLVRESQADEARECLEAMGYELRVVSGLTREFKAGAGIAEFKDLYRSRPQRSVDLHLLPFSNGGGAMQPEDLLSRAQRRSFNGLLLPVLSPEDIFIQQALHLFKHICSEHTRALWVLEFRQHVIAKRNKAQFWSSVRSLAGGTPGAVTAIGVCTLLAARLFGPFAPTELSHWSVERLSPSICLWVHLYGRRTLLSSFPGSKLYLLLQQELMPDTKENRAVLLRRLLPFHRPSNIMRTETISESASTPRLLRYRIQAKFLGSRLRMHVIEGVRYAIEAVRWRRRVERFAPDPAPRMIPSGGSLER